MHNVKILKLKLLILSFTLPAVAFSLPIDWHGVFGVDSTLIDTYRKIEQSGPNNPTSTDTGSQEVDLASGNHANASFQSYLVRLEPVIIVNDSATIKGEISTAYGRGARLGETSGDILNNGFANAFYYYNNNSGTSSKNNLNFNQLYMELYADTATYQIGRHAFHWGLGALYNSGKNVWDRHAYLRDGITVNFKLGSFDISPFFAKLGTSGSLTRATKTREFGVSILYDNPDREIAFGLIYSEKKNNSFNGTISSSVSGTNVNLGRTDVEITDIFLSKKLGDFELSVEVPILSGDLGNVYNNGFVTRYKAKAFIFESKYNMNDSWTLGVNAGHVSGDSGGSTSFDALFLNPNYQIANLMFRYNLMAVGSNSLNIFDGSITNTKYAKFFARYASDKSVLRTSFVYAIANETAKTGTTSYNHLTNRNFSALADQDDAYGFEVDVDYDYLWNNEVTVGVGLGYHFVGDYYSFSNQAGAQNTSKNSYMFQVKSVIDF